MTFREKMEKRLKERQARNPGRSRKYMKMYKGDEEEMLEDLDLDEILEVDEDEVEFVDECPPGCKPVDEEGEGELSEELEDILEDEEGDALDLDEDRDKDSMKLDRKKPMAQPDAKAEVEEPTEYHTRLMTVGELQEVKPEDVSMMYFDSDDPHYVLFAAGVPFGEIRRSSLNLSDDNVGMFTDEIFPTGVLDMVERFGAVEALERVKVHYYSNNTTADQQYQKAEAAVKADADTAYAKRVAELKNDLLSKMTTAFEASRKNFILANPLKDALVENIKTAGTTERVAIDMVEDAFQAAGPHYFNELLKTAEEWMGYEPEAFTQIKSNIQKMSVLDPTAVAEQLETDEPVEAAPEFKAAALQSVPAPEPEADYEADEAAVRARLRRAHWNKKR